jgi:hypothetical protein
MTLSLVEIDSQHVELLPARTVMSLFNLGGDVNGSGGNGGNAKSGPVACGVSIGNLTAALSLILGGAAGEGDGSSCNSTATGGAGGTGVVTKH